MAELGKRFRTWSPEGVEGLFGWGFLIQGSGEPLGNVMGAGMVLSWNGTPSPRRKEPRCLPGPESAGGVVTGRSGFETGSCES